MSSRASKPPPRPTFPRLSKASGAATASKGAGTASTAAAAGPSAPPDAPAAARTRTSRPPRVERDAASVELRLSIGRDGLGLELARPATLGLLTVPELLVSLPGVRFPLDVSGGVARFRHRRGALVRLTVEANARTIERIAAPRLRGLLGPDAPGVWIAARKDAATVGIVDRGEAARVLAFDVTLDTHEGDARFTVTRARGLGLPAPPTALALTAMRAVLGKGAHREGARFVLRDATTALARALLPEAGARAPSSEGVRWSVTAAHADTWILHASDRPQAEPTEEAGRAREAALTTRAADDALAAGDLEAARGALLAALERAPRHPAVSARIVEIDRLAGGRAEGALATVAEAARDPQAPPSVVAAELYVETGDVGAAIAAFARAAEEEPVPALAACAFERAASLVADPLDALAYLDRAVARAPSIARTRWLRIERRLAAGRVEDALADVEHVEAMTSGARAKHAVWRRAGGAWRSAGLAAEATVLFERALRFDPDDAEALAGLGAALVEMAPHDRRGARGVALLTRAIDLAEARGAIASQMRIDLARALVGVQGDRPSAVARLRDVPHGAPEALEARGLEGRLRAELGDRAGASLAFARLRDLAATRSAPGEGAIDALAASMLAEAARFERDERGDLLAAQRHLAAALRLFPRDAEIGRAYREVGAAIAPAPSVASAPSRPAEPARIDAPATEAPARVIAFDDGPDDEASAEDAARVDELTRVLQADPTRDDVVDELVTRLLRLGRGMELLALLSARLEDAPPARRAELLPKQRDVLTRLEDEALAAGRAMEASLYRDARAALDEN